MGVTLRLRRAAKTRLLVATVIGGGAAAVASVLLVSSPLAEHAFLPRVLALVVVTAVAELVAIRLPHGSQSELITLTEVAVVADVVLLPASTAVVVALGGLALALMIQRRSPVKALFNLAQYGLGIVVASGLYHGVGGGDFDSVAGLISLVLGIVAFTGMNLVSISAILSATQDRRFRTVLSDEAGLSLAIGVGGASIGLVAVSQLLTRPVLVPFVLAPTLAMHLAFRGWVRQKELSSKLGEDKAKLERIVEHSSEGIVLADASGVVALWSPSMEHITGIPSADAVGKQVAYLLRGRGSHGQAVAVEPSADASAFELELMTPHGEVRWLAGQHGPGRDSDGALLFDVLVVTDVTRQREVERLKGDFISTVSHELRTPLTPIKGYASLLLRRGEEIPADRRRDALAAIIDRADHMARLVEDLLLASSMSREGERRLPEVQRQPVDVATLLDRVARPFRARYPHHEIVVEEPGAIRLFTDPLRAEQMIANVVSNALKFSDEGTTVTVGVVADGPHAAIRVRDEGRGIPADKLEAIFDRFRRLEDPLRMETGGAGLGLFVARQLARAMDAEISVASEPGRGSVFTIRIPILASSGAADGSPKLFGNAAAAPLAG